MPMRTWGDGYGYLLVATGRMDAMVDPEVSAYDVAAMPVVLAEAGGRFTDRGDDGYDGGSGLATNGLLHDEVLALPGSPRPGVDAPKLIAVPQRRPRDATPRRCRTRRTLRTAMGAAPRTP